MAKDKDKAKEVTLPFKKDTKGTYVYGNDDGETAYIRKSRIEGDRPDSITITFG